MRSVTVQLRDPRRPKEGYVARHGYRALCRAISTLALLWAGPGLAAQPNIVLLLTDDEAPSLADRMPTVQALAARGATFTRAYYNDPLCEPSRATILTGQYAQNTGVTSNGVHVGSKRARITVTGRHES